MAGVNLQFGSNFGRFWPATFTEKFFCCGKKRKRTISWPNLDAFFKKVDILIAQIYISCQNLDKFGRCYPQWATGIATAERRVATSNRIAGGGNMSVDFPRGSCCMDGQIAVTWRQWTSRGCHLFSRSTCCHGNWPATIVLEIKSPPPPRSTSVDLYGGQFLGRRIRIVAMSTSVAIIIIIGWSSLVIMIPPGWMKRVAPWWVCTNWWGSSFSD